MAPGRPAGADLPAGAGSRWLALDGGRQGPAQPLKTIALGRQPTGIALDERAGRAAVINTGSASVTMLDTRDGAVVATVAMGRSRRASRTSNQLPLAVAMDGRTGHTFVAGSGPGGPNFSGVSTLDTRQGGVLRNVQIPGIVRGIAVDERIGRAFVLTDVAFSKPARGGVTILDTGSGAVLRVIPVGVRPMVVAVDTRAHRAFIGNDVSGTVTILDSVTGAVAGTVVVGQDPTDAAVDARTGRAFVVNLSGATTRPTLWDRLGCRVERFFNKWCSGQPYVAPPSAGSVSMLDASR